MFFLSRLSSACSVFQPSTGTSLLIQITLVWTVFLTLQIKKVNQGDVDTYNRRASKALCQLLETKNLSNYSEHFGTSDDSRAPEDGENAFL